MPTHITQEEFMKIRAVFAVLAAAVTLVSQTFAADKPKNATESANLATAVAAPVPATGVVVVARVNGMEIKRKELDIAVRALIMQMARQNRSLPPSQTATMDQDVLEQLIGRELLLQEGNKHIPADLEKQVAEQVDQTKAQLGGEEEFKAKLAESGLTAEGYTRNVREGFIVRAAIQAFVDKEVKIAPEEVKAFYDKNPDQFKQPELVRASHILIQCASDASDEVKKEKLVQIEAVRALVKGGEKFADVARKVSEDPGTARTGGDLGFFARGRMVPEFDTAAFSLKTNEISPVITTQYGYHVLVVTDRKPAGTMPFDKVKTELTEFLKQQKGAEVARNHVAELRRAAKVEIFLPAPPPAPVVVTPPAPAPGK
jgi:peptidyl-prolyl cis-trans isomerase C